MKRVSIGFSSCLEMVPGWFKGDSQAVPGRLKDVSRLPLISRATQDVSAS